VPREAYRIGVPLAAAGASGSTATRGLRRQWPGNLGALKAETLDSHGHDHSLNVRLPLAVCADAG